jgi:hypothetical protein
VTPVERAKHYAALPSWRKPLGVMSVHDAAERQERSIREAIVDLLGDAQLTRDEIAAGVIEDWGHCSPEQVGAALRELVTDDVIRRSGERYRLRGGR